MDEGQELFLRALRLRFLGQSEEADVLFEAAAEAGSGDACWHLYVEFYHKKRYMISANGFDEWDWLSRGFELGNELCIAATCVWDMQHKNLLCESDWPHTPNAKVVINMMWPKLDPSSLSIKEVKTLCKAAEAAILIHDPTPVMLYFEYMTNFEQSLLSVEPRMLGHALFLLGSWDSTFGVDSFELSQITLNNSWHLPTRTRDIAQCVYGMLYSRYTKTGVRTESANILQCIHNYKNAQQCVQPRVLAWLGCFRRGALRHLNRDTATLIAKILACPIRWAESFWE